MFTGIIEDIGEIRSIQRIDGGIRIAITAQKVSKILRIGDSVSVNGVCQTVVCQTTAHFEVEAVGETLEKTTLGALETGDRVNLELPVKADGRMGGHFVQGHVNGTGKVRQWYPRGENYFLEIEVPPNLMRYIIGEGSIAVEGISLTVAAITDHGIGINIIPHTANETNLKFKKIGAPVNLEVDMIAKYIENFLSDKYTQEKPPKRA